MREELNICSTNWNGLEPKKGMEEAWDQCRQKIEILKDMIQSLESEPVRRAFADWKKEKTLADWQKDIIENGIQTELRL